MIVLIGIVNIVQILRFLKFVPEAVCLVVRNLLRLSIHFFVLLISIIIRLFCDVAR